MFRSLDVIRTLATGYYCMITIAITKGRTVTVVIISHLEFTSLLERTHYEVERYELTFTIS